MEVLFDTLASSTWLWLFVLFALLGGAGAVYFIRPFQKQALNNILSITLSIVFFFVMIYLTRSQYGYAVEFVDVKSNGKEIALIERHEVGDGDGGSSTAYRLYILDISTGKRKVRQLSNSSLLAVTDRGVIMNEYQRIVVYDLETGDEKNEWSSEKGFEKFPELRSGLASLNADSYAVKGSSGSTQYPFLRIVAQDGHEYFFDFDKEQLLTERPSYTGSNQSFYFDTYGMRVEGPTRYSYSFVRENGEIEKLIFSSDEQEQKEYGGDFLDPELVGCNFDKRILIVKHFQTLKKDETIVTAISFDLKKLWEVRQSELDVVDSFDENPTVGATLSVDDKLILTFGGFVVCLKEDDGSVVWKSRQ
jgi:hypothetical protein